MLKYISLLWLCVGCSSINNSTSDEVAPLIEKVVVQKWQSPAENRYTLTISVYLKDSLLENFVLENIYYNHQMSSITQKDNRLYVATFEGILFVENQSFADVTNEYGNKPPLIVIPPVKIKDHEALLIYRFKGKEKLEILSKLTVNPVIVYPGVRH